MQPQNTKQLALAIVFGAVVGLSVGAFRIVLSPCCFDKESRPFGRVSPADPC